MNKPALKISFLSRFLPLFLTLALSLPAGVYPEPSRRALRGENAIDAGLEEKIGRALSQTKSAVGLEENFADKVRQRVVQELENFFSSYERRSS